MTDKRELRKIFLARRTALSEPVRQKADGSITEKILSLDEFRDAVLVTGYATDGTEPDVLPVLRAAICRGAAAALPKWNGSEYILSMVDENDLNRLAPGKWGLNEPLTEKRIPDDLLRSRGILYLVPGVAFDESFARLGRGGGIYDRILRGRKHAIALGVFYECQFAEALPVESHDEPLDVIVTDSAVRRRLTIQED